jgi:amino-acid N-acetyltransferase
MGDVFLMSSATREDMPEVAALLDEANLPIEGVDEQIGAGYVVARAGEGIVGVCGVEEYGPDGLLRSVAVHPSLRDRSLGCALVEDRISWAKNEGLKRLYLLTTDAEAYFVRFGFTRIEREETPATIRSSSEFSSLCPDTAVVMVLSLDDPGEDG